MDGARDQRRMRMKGGGTKGVWWHSAGGPAASRGREPRDLERGEGEASRVELRGQVDRPGEPAPRHEGQQAGPAAGNPDVGPESVEAAQRQALLLRVELPGVEVQHRRRRVAALVKLPQGGLQ